jgi:hypothetical protein
MHQTHDYVKLSCATYIKQVLQTHGWEKPAAYEPDQHDSVPLSADPCKLLSTLEGGALESKVGYGYCQVLGKIIYAYVVCCLDIGYAAMFLSRFSQAPAREHYKALKDIVKYLWHTVDWGIIYWQQNPVNSLPRINLPDIPH